MKTMGGSDKCKTHAEWLEELRNEAAELRAKSFFNTADVLDGIAVNLEAARNREFAEKIESLAATMPDIIQPVIERAIRKALKVQEQMFEPVGGNVSALLEAVDALCAISESDIGELRALSARLNDESVYGGGLIASIVHYIGNLRAALAMPRRNCDVGTVEEQEERYKATGETYHTLTLTNALKWAQMPYGDTQKGGADAT